MQKCYKYSHIRLIRDLKLIRMAHSNASKFFHPSHQKFFSLSNERTNNQWTELTTKIVHFKYIDGPASIHFISNSNENYFYFSYNWLIICRHVVYSRAKKPMLQHCNVENKWNWHHHHHHHRHHHCYTIVAFCQANHIIWMQCTTLFHTQSFNQSTQIPKIRALRKMRAIT